MKEEILRVRLTSEEKSELEKLASILEEDTSATARRAISALLRHAKASNYQLTLPLEFATATEAAKVTRKAA